MDLLLLMLEFTHDQTPLEPESAGDFAYKVKGRVVAVEDDDARTLIGKFRLYYIDADAAREAGHALLDVLDERAETIAYWEPLYGQDGLASDALTKLLGEPVYANALILDRLEILPQYRGRNIGLAVLRRLIERFSAGTGVIAMKPFPLQFEASSSAEPDSWRDQLGIGQLSTDEKASVARLQIHYAKLGFKPLPKSDLMFRATESRLPTLKKLKLRLT